MGSTKNEIKTSATTPEEDEEACLYAMQLSSASVLPMILKSAVELDLLEIIAKSGVGAYVSPSEIASKLPTTNPAAAVMLDRMLRLLASYKVLTCKLNTLDDGRVERLYGLAPVCKYLIKDEDGVSLASLVLMNQDKVQMESWYYFKDAILDGEVAFNKAHGMTAYEYHGTDPRFSKIFNIAMADPTTITMKKILETYKGFEGLNSIVDVGGGFGATISKIVSKYPSIKGINFDMPQVIEHAPTCPGVEHVGGDMFASVPKGDAIFMKWILHGWTDEDALKILKNCYKALPANGKVIIADAILPVFPETNASANTAFHIDVLMLALTPGGKERTEKEFEALAKAAGFSGFKVVCCVHNSWIMEFCK